MLSVDPSKHMAMMDEAASKEEILLDPSGAPLTGEAAAKAKAERSSLVKSFEYKFDEKGLSVPSFKWKSNDSNEKLSAYATSLRKILEQIEERLTRP
jgi:hypothetical protein